MSSNKSADRKAAKSKEIAAEHDQEFGCGLLLINDHLVPSSFIEYVAESLAGAVVHRGAIMSVREVCGADFWNVLHERERQVVGHVLLMLIEQGRVELCRPAGH